MDPILSERRARHEQRRAAAAAKTEAKARVNELQARAPPWAAGVVGVSVAAIERRVRAV